LSEGVFSHDIYKQIVRPQDVVVIFIGHQKVHSVPIEETDTIFGDGRAVKKMRVFIRRYLYAHPQPVSKFDVAVARIALFMLRFTIGIIIAFCILLAIIF
jgi:hypothetical protein